MSKFDPMRRFLLAALLFCAPVLALATDVTPGQTAIRDRAQAQGAYLLPAGTTIQLVAGTNSAINLILSGTEVPASGGPESYKFVQQTLTTSAVTYYTVPAATTFMMTSMTLENRTASLVSGVTVYLNGSAAANQWFSFSIPASDVIQFIATIGWQTVDVNGAQSISMAGYVPLTRLLTTTAPLKIAGGTSADLSADRAFTCDVASGSQPGCLSSTDWTTFNGKLSSPVDLGSGNASGTLAAARFPALTGDCTTIAGALATTCTKTSGTAFGTAATSSPDGSTLEISGSTLREKDAGTTNAKLAVMTTKTVKANLTGGTASPTDVATSGSGTTIPLATGATMSVAYLNKTCYADQQTGATADVQIGVCNTALIALGGGTIDATGYGATTQSINAVVPIGDSSGHPVTLRIDRVTIYNITVTGGSGVDVFQVFIRSALVAVGAGNPPTGNFVVQATTNVNSIVATYPRASQWVGLLQGFVIMGSPSATVLSQIDVSGAVALSRIQDVGAYNFNGNGLKITANAGATVDELVLDQVSIDGTGGTTGCPVLIDGTASGNVITGINFISGVYVHPGASCASHAIIDIEGGASNTIQGVHSFGTRLESANTTDIGWLINNATGVDITGTSASANVNNGTSIVKITATLGVSYGITLTNVLQHNAWTNTIQDVVNSVTLTSAAYPRVNHYEIKPPQDGSWMAVQGGVVMRLPRTCKLIADHATQSAIAPSNITWSNSCIFQVDASTTYRFECDVFSSTSNVAGGLFMGLTGPASPVAATYYITEQKTQASPGTYFSQNLTHTTTYSVVGVGSVGQTISTVFPARFAGTFENGTTAGTLSIQIANGSATGALTLKRGSSCTVY